MSLVVIGLNHRTTPVELLERMAVPSPELPKALHTLERSENLAEVAVLSTCNRTEVYAARYGFHPAVEDVRNFLTDQSSLDPDTISDHLYTYHDDAAVAHLFGVAAGVDSMIVGEGEILGQVRGGVAGRRARIDDRTARVARLPPGGGGRQACPDGDRIGRHAVSVPSAAVTVAGERLGGLEGRRVLVIGAGDVGAAMAVVLNGAGVSDITVANRSPERGAELAARVGGRAIGLDGVIDNLIETDVLLASTGASDVLLERGEIEAVMSRPWRSCAPDRRHRRAAQRRPRCQSGLRRDAPRHRRPQGVRGALARTAPAGDRQGAGDHHRGARTLPARALGP